MNIKEAKKLKSGAIVREAWDTRSINPRTGLVLGKTHIVENHMAKTLCQEKNQRYDVVVHWFNGPRGYSEWSSRPNPEVLQNWELMIISHAK